VRDGPKIRSVTPAKVASAPSAMWGGGYRYAAHQLVARNLDAYSAAGSSRRQLTVAELCAAAARSSLLHTRAAARGPRGPHVPDRRCGWARRGTLRAAGRPAPE
jgi:hypothetical protein